VTTDIICAVHNGAAYLDDLFASLQRQTVTEWRCWVRDDGSTDASADRVAAWAAREPRITLLHRGAPALGAAGAFGWLLERLPRDADVVCCADHDDVWLPERIERSRSALRAAEAAEPGPILVHTDLEVVDATLRPLHPSFWRAAALAVEPATVRRIAVDNVVTGSTITMNRALVELLGAPAPDTVVHQDAWFALAAAAFGRIVALPEVTVRYRQHGSNAVGALARTARGVRGAAGALRRAAANGAVYRTQLARSCALAAAFVERFGARLGAADRAFLEEYAALPSRGALARKLGVLRLRARPGRGLLSALGEVLRA
jgi:glycosyltransferase involved in cell wall biosynthesis